MPFQNSKLFYNTIKFSIFLLLFISSISCATTQKWTLENGEKYLNVSTIGIIGDGKTDNKQAIEDALNRGGNYYFPKGNYLINSYTYVYNIICVNKNSTGIKLLFDENARVIMADNLIPKGAKGCLFSFISDKANIPFVEIKNLHIEGNKKHQEGMICGILAYEKDKYFIQNFDLQNVTVKNTSSSGIHTEALNNHFSKIKTENCGSHGIGINHTANPNVEHYFYLDGHISINDEAYSIDFSGPSDEKDEKKSKKEYFCKGTAKNITSINALYGIKTAGYWDLDLENVKIINSRNNGFVLSKDAPNKKVTIKNLHVIKCKGNGLYLPAKSNFYGENIKLDSCHAPLIIYNTKTKIKNLQIKNDLKNIACIQISGEDNPPIEIDSFVIENTNKENTYIISNFNNNLKLSNGFIQNNESPYFLYLSPTVKTCELSNMDFKNNKFYNIITPDGTSKTLKLNKIKGFSKQNIIRKLENRQQDKLIQTE